MRQKLSERARDPVLWTSTLQIVKTVIAAVGSWVIAVEVFGLSQPFLAPWAALLTVHATIYSTFRRGAQQVGATVLGVLLAFLAGSLFGVNAATLGDAVIRFATGHHSAYPVVDDERRPVAIVTRTDVIDADRDDPTPLVEAATSPVVTATYEDTAQAVLQLMVDEHVDHVPIVRDGRLAGICTRSDLLKVRREQFALERRPVRATA